MRDAFRVMPNATIWKTFQEQFCYKFIPDHVYQKKEKEFIALRQNQMAVAIYLHTFLRLFEFAKELIDTEAKKVKRFIGGLHPMYEEHVVMYKGPETFDDAVDRVYTAEEMAIKNRSADPKRSTFQSSKGFRIKDRRVW